MGELPNRRSLRLAAFDYRKPGAYFVTICTRGKSCLFVGAFKSASSRRIAVLSRSYRSAVWQWSYYERIVRDIGELNSIRKYIANNPARRRAGM
jgi:REP element-mobilizing transposase RayT